MKSFPLNRCLHGLTWTKDAFKHLQKLIDILKSRGAISSERIEKAMLSVYRHEFVPKGSFNDAYEDRPQGIGYNVTISAPHMHAYALQKLEPFLKPDSKVLDVGSGSGILCVYLHYMIGKSGKIVGIEHMPGLVERSIKDISKSHKELLDSKQIEIIEGDGRYGWEKESPYDCIHVGAAMDKQWEDGLVAQLKENGALLAPINNNQGYQDFMLITKQKGGKVVRKELFGCTYVPLTSRDQQYPNWSKSE